MKAAVVVTIAELDAVFRQLVPLEVDLSSIENGRRVISIHRVSRVDLIPDVGIRVVGAAEVEWTVLGITVPMKVDDLALRIHLELEDGKLGFRFEIECADVRLVPELVEGLAWTRINEALRDEAAIPAFHFAELVARRVALPEWLGPLRDLVLGDGGGFLWIEAETITFMVGVDIAARPRPLGASLPQAEAR